MRQLIIARKDLQMSPGKLAAQCCHASMAFMTSNMRNESSIDAVKNKLTGEKGYYESG